MKNIRLVIFLVMITSSYSVFPLLNLLRLAPEQGLKAKLPLPTGANDKQEHLAALQADLEEQKSNNEERQRTIAHDLEQLDATLEPIKEQLRRATGSQLEFLNKEQALLNETRQVLLTMQFASNQIAVPLEQHIILLQDYLYDVNFTSLQLPDRSFFTYQEFELGSKKVLSQEEKVQLLTEQHNEIVAEQANLQQRLLSVTREYELKKREQQDFTTKSMVPTGIEGDFDSREQGVLLDLQKNLYGYEKKLVKLKLDESKKKLAFINSSISIEQERLKVLKANLEKIRRALRIDQHDFQEAKDTLEEQKKASLIRQEELYTTITELATQKEVLVRRLDQAKKRYHVNEGGAVALADWSTLPKTADQIMQACELGLYSEQIKLIEATIDYQNLLIELEKAAFQYEKNKVDILFSWADILKRKGRASDLATELKRYQTLQSETEHKIATLKEKRTAASNVLDLEHKALNSIKKFLHDLKGQASLFKLHPTDYTVCLDQVASIETVINKKIEVQSSILQTYGTIQDTLNMTVYQLSSIITELEKKSIWQRSEYAISSAGIKNIASDIKYFIQDVRALIRVYLMPSHIDHVKAQIRSFIHDQEKMLIWLVRILGLIILFLILRTGLGRLAGFLLNYQTDNKQARLLVTLCGALISFIRLHLTGLFVWFIMFILVLGGIFDEPVFEILFYLCSIPYLCYLTSSFVSFIIAFNQREHYLFFGEGYQRRFMIVFSIFGYATALLLLSREAFIAGMYYTSELPTILLAGYSIIIRALLIFSIGRDELAHLLPSRGAFWPKVTRLVTRYYYPLLIVIIFLMMLSDPYVGGYGNLVAYFLWGIIGTIVLVKVLLMLQQYIKNVATNLFLYTDDEAPRERFSHARSWYGIFVVTLSILFLAIGILLCLWIWGQPISWYDVKQFLEFELFETSIKDGKTIWFTPQKLLVVIGFIVGGFWLAIIINRFVMTKIFQLLPVDLGIQHMVTSLTRYLVVVVAIFIGFQWAGLGTLLIAIGLVIGSIGYLVREPLADFLSYFIILVQRPIKIGDLVMIGEEPGFVRHITPRSVILRAKNSYTLVIPNSTVIAQPLRNWNYMRGYVAFDDITVTIPYAIDPVKVKEIIADVLNSSHILLKIPAPIIRLENFGENGYEFLVRGFVSSDKTVEIWDIASDIRLQLVQALRKNNIVIAVPTRAVVTLRSHKPRQPNEFAKLFNNDGELE
jgi:small-conductance mechanosensitive channel